MPPYAVALRKKQILNTPGDRVQWNSSENLGLPHEGNSSVIFKFLTFVYAVCVLSVEKCYF